MQVSFSSGLVTSSQGCVLTSHNLAVLTIVATIIFTPLQEARPKYCHPLCSFPPRGRCQGYYCKPALHWPEIVRVQTPLFVMIVGDSDVHSIIILNAFFKSWQCIRHWQAHSHFRDHSSQCSSIETGEVDSLLHSMNGE